MPKKKYTHGRHTSAFILLFLSEQPAYGSILLNKMEQLITFETIDSAAIYRSLQNLEKDGLVETTWDTTDSGPAKKWYTITEKGYIKLAEFKEDIERRKQLLHYFLEKYEGILSKKGSK